MMKNLNPSAKSPPVSRGNGTKAIIDPAQPLRNPRWEQFAHLVLVMDQTKAYREAFPSSRDSKARHVWERASKLAAKVAPRVNFLRAQQSERLALTPERVLRRYSDIAFMDLPSIISWRKVNGSTEAPVFILEVEDFERLTPAQREAIKRVNISRPDKDGHQTVAVELHDPLKALEALAKHLGLFQAEEKTNVGQVSITINIGGQKEMDLRAKELQTSEVDLQG